MLGRTINRVRHTFAVWTAPPGASALRRFVKTVQFFLLLLAAPFLVLVSFAPTRQLLQAHGLYGPDTIQAITVLVIALLIPELDDIRKSVNRLADLISRSHQESAHSHIVSDGIVGVYAPLADAVRRADDTKQSLKHMTVLCLTCYSSWPFLQPWLERATTTGWTIDIYCLCPGFIKRREEEIPTDWAETASVQIKNIRGFVRDHKADLDERGVAIRLHTYQVVPAVHGFYLDDGTLFFGVAQWSPQKRLSLPHQFFDYFDRADASERATAYRQAFNNWVEQARLSEVVPTSGSGSLVLGPMSVRSPA